MKRIEERDLWWEARQSHQPNLLFDLGRWVTQSLPGQPAKEKFLLQPFLGHEKVVLAVDLNKYRANRNLEAYRDAGVDVFILRIGGPAQWIEGDYRYTMDSTYRPYLEQLDQLGLVGQSIGYIVHNPHELWTINGATGETIHTELIDEWTSGGWMPQAFVYDHEVYEVWRGGTKIKQTAPNVIKSLATNTDNTWKKYHRMVGIYTARWFINTVSVTEHVTYLDNINRPVGLGGEGTQRPMWYAWYPQTFSKHYTGLRQALEELLDPTPSQINAYLQCGSHSLAKLWQFTSTLKLSGDDIGVDANVSLCPKQEFLDAFGLAGAPQPPEPEPDDLTERVAVLEGQISSLIGTYNTHTHETGGPKV